MVLSLKIRRRTEVLDQGSPKPLHKTITMAAVNPLNIFQGPDSLRKYFNPDEQPLLPLVELPEKLNPFLRDGVRIYAKMLTALPAQNVKALPGEIAA